MQLLIAVLVVMFSASHGEAFDVKSPIFSVEFPDIVYRDNEIACRQFLERVRLELENARCGCEYFRSNCENYRLTLEDLREDTERQYQEGLIEQGEYRMQMSKLRTKHVDYKGCIRTYESAMAHYKELERSRKKENDVCDDTIGKIFIGR